MVLIAVHRFSERSTEITREALSKHRKLLECALRKRSPTRRTRLGESNPGQSSIWTVSRRFLQSKFLFVGLHTLPYKGSGQEDARNACGWSCHVRPRAPCLPGHDAARLATIAVACSPEHLSGCPSRSTGGPRAAGATLARRLQPLGRRRLAMASRLLAAAAAGGGSSRAVGEGAAEGAAAGRHADARS